METAGAAPGEVPKPLKLRAIDDEDLAILSACLQDALVLVADILYEPEAARLALVADRFRWEAGEPPGAAAASTGAERVTTALTICQVRAVKRRGFDPRAADQFLSLLALHAEPGPAAAPGMEPSPTIIRLDFSADRSIRLEVAAVQVFLEDLAEPRPTRWRPRHTL